MRKKETLLTLPILFLLCAFSPATMGQATQTEYDRTSTNSPAEIKRQAKHLTPLRSSAEPEGSRVIIKADMDLSDYAAYRSGERFVVIIPQADASAALGGVGGHGFTDIKVEQKGEDVALSFRLEAGATARVSQKFNRLDILITGTEASASQSRARIEEAEAVNNPKPAQPPVQRQYGMRNHRLPAQGLSSLLDLFKANTQADALNLDLSVPESPAFTVLGLTPQDVVRPATPREFATSLLNSLDKNGNFQTGLAIDTAPFMLINGPNVTIKDYNDYYLTRLLSRIQFSFAATKGASKDDLSTRLGMGLNLTLWDEGDPRVYHPGRPGDVLDCFVRNLSTTLIIPPTITTDEELQKFVAAEEARLKPIADQCRDNGRKANWNRSSWTIAFAPSWISKTGDNSNFKWNGGAFWTSVAYGFENVPSLENIAQLIFHARYRTRERVADPNNQGQFITQDSSFFGGRFRAGSPRFALNFEDSFVRNKPIGGKVDSINRMSIGAEARLADNLYFVISTGSNIGADNGRKKGFVFTSFKYGFNKKSQFTPKQ